MPPRPKPPGRAATLCDLRLTTLAMLCATLAACGGGGGGGGSSPSAADSAMNAGTTAGNNAGNNAGTMAGQDNPAPDRQASTAFLAPGLNRPLTPPATPSLPLQPASFTEGVQAAYYNSINLKPARDQNLTGRGVAVGLVDSGVRADTLWVNIDRSVGGDYNNGTRVDAVQANQQLHGGLVATTLAGQIQPQRGSLGGIAPQVTVYSANVRIPGSDDASAANVVTAWTDLSGQGVRLLNTSLSTATGAASIAQWAEYRDNYNNSPAATRALTMVGGALNAVNNDSLIVVAGGNGDPDTKLGHVQPSAEALLPRIEPALRRGFITAVAADANGDIESWADRCGNAAQWCMAANSHAYIKPGEDVTHYDVVPGSSFSAPQIVGTAALLLEKYPWMSNDNLRTTLLTTATDRGAPGVDAVYGWGLLNVGRAVDGPAQFAFGDFQAQLRRSNGQWGSYEFRNDISGTGGLQVSGEGTLILAGKNNYNGPTVINSGILDVAGSITSATQIAAGGTLTGLGTTAGVNNDGTVYNGGKGLNIRGNYQQSNQGLLITDLGSLLNVSGQANLAGAVHVNGVRQGYVPRAGMRTTFLSAARINGQFASFTSNPGLMLDGQIMYTATTASIDITRIAANLAARQLPAADASQPLITAAADKLERVFTALDGAALTQTASQPLATAALLEGASALQAIADPQVLKQSLYSLSGAAYANADVMQSLAREQRFNSFAQHLTPLAAGDSATFFEMGHRSANWRPAGLDGSLRSHDVMAGLSRRLNDDWTLAGAISLAEQRWTEDYQAPANDRSRGPSGGLMLGLRQALGQSAYVKYLLGAQMHHNHVERQLWLGEAPEQVKATAKGHSLQAGAALGQQWKLSEGVTLLPEAGVFVDYSHLSDFSESGAQGYGLRALARDVTIPSLRAQMAASFEPYPGRFNIDALLSVQQDLKPRDFRRDGGFAAAPMTQSLSGQWKVGRTRWGAGLNLRANTSEHLSLALSYQGEWSQNWRSHAVAGSLLYRF